MFDFRCEIDDWVPDVRGVYLPEGKAESGMGNFKISKQTEEKFCHREHRAHREMLVFGSLVLCG